MDRAYIDGVYTGGAYMDGAYTGGVYIDGAYRPIMLLSWGLSSP
jgi:uncharacterized membrane protein